MNELLSFVKIGSKENITNLYEEGQVHMRTTKYFRESEDNNQIPNLRKDKYEGASAIFRKGKLEIFKDQNRIGYASNPDLVIRGEKDEGYIFCVTSILASQISSNKRMKLPIDKRIEKFGDTALLVYKPKDFLSLFTKCLKEQNINFKLNLVNYIELKQENIPYSIFTKPMNYEYQNETRFFVQMEEKEDYLNFNIGNLKDISLIMPVADLFQLEMEFEKIKIR